MNYTETVADTAIKTYSGIPYYFFNDKILKAREYANLVHDGQKYGGGLPYIAHLEQVYKVFLEFVIEPYVTNVGQIDQIINKYDSIACALWLHDAIEDTTTTKDEIEDIFGPAVAELVYAVSGEGKNRKEKLANIASKIEDCNVAVLIKLCDRIANTRFSSHVYYSGNTEKSPFLMYVKEYPAFKEYLGKYYSDVGYIQKMWTILDLISKE